ncbi:MAG TPA: hypothetical protein PKA98_10175 [Acidimicrobiales bacterium]|nr:hypothetical protein [Acidimicrobiales bacterium]
MTNAPLPPNGGPGPEAGPVPGSSRAPASRGRKIAAAVSAGAFAGIAIGLVATQAGADDDAPSVPVANDGATSPSPFTGPSDQFGGGSGTQDLDGDGFGDGSSTDQFAPPSSGATPTPFGGQSAPDTNSGGS